MDPPRSSGQHASQHGSSSESDWPITSGNGRIAQPPAQDQQNLPDNADTLGKTARHPQTGSPSLVIIVSSPECRKLASDLTSDNAPETFRSLIDLSAVLEIDGQQWAEGQFIWGIALLDGWEVLDQCRSALEDKLVACLRKSHCQSRHIRFLRHRILRSACLPTPTPLPSSNLHPLAILKALDMFSCKETSPGSICGQPEYDIGISSIITKWRSHLASSSQTHLLVTSWPLASLFVGGRLSIDVTAIMSKDNSRTLRLNSPLLPPRRLLQVMRRLGSSMGSANPFQMDTGTGTTVNPGVESWGGPRRMRFEAGHAVRATISTRSLANMSNSKQSCADQLNFLFPDSSGKGLSALESLEASGFHFPSTTSLRRFQIRFDIAAMLGHRHHHAMHGPFFHYLFCDASPQNRQSVEIFVSGEYIIPQQDLVTAIDGHSYAMNLHPLATLGVGCASASDKLQALVHQYWLQYGPDLGVLRSVFHNVRSVLTDMGVEMGIANARDCLTDIFPKAPVQLPIHGGCTLHGHPGPCDGQQDYLFPNALQIPGTKHIVDLIVRMTVATLDWFPPALEVIKNIVQLMNRVRKRQKMEAVIAEKRGQPGFDDDSVQRFLEMLKMHPAAFASWRWTSLADSVRYVLRVKDVLQILFRSLTKEQSRNLGIATKEGMAAAAEIACGQIFEKCRALRYILQPLSRLLSWVGGCSCHELTIPDSSDGELEPQQTSTSGQPQCPFKGVRGPVIAEKIAATVGILDKRRLQVTSGHATFSELDSTGIVNALTTALAMLQTKFAWVTDIPYLIWQAGPFVNHCLPFLSCGHISQQRTHLSSPGRQAQCCQALHSEV